MVKRAVADAVASKPAAKPSSSSHKRSSSAERASKPSALASASSAEAERERIASLEDAIKSDRKNANKLKELLSLLHSSHSASVSRAVFALQRVFARFVSSGDLELHDESGASSNASASSAAAKSTATPSSDALEQFRSWLKERFATYRSFLENAIGNAQAGAATAVTYARILLKFVEAEGRTRKPSGFSNQVFAGLVRALLHSAHCAAIVSEVIAPVASNGDVRYFLAVNISKEVDFATQNKKANAQFIRNTYAVLLLLDPPVTGGSGASKKGSAAGRSGMGGSGAGGAKDSDGGDTDAGDSGSDSDNDDGDNDVLGGDSDSGDGGSGGGAHDGKRASAQSSSDAVSLFVPLGTGGGVAFHKLREAVTTSKRYRREWSTAWLALLRLELPVDLYKTVLRKLRGMLMRNLSHPVQLADFLVDSYAVGGVVSMLALDSLFVLMSEHNLELPSFYPRLYASLKPEVFLAKYRSRYFELLDLCLTSTHLPSYIVAAFVKRLARFALTLSPPGALLSLSFIAALLRRHPACKVLIHRTAMAPGASSSGDPYKPDEEANLEKCGALESSLWELDVLRNHYFADVARMVRVFETDLVKLDVDPEDFVSTTYGQLMERTQHLPRDGKVSVAFHKPTTLFDETACQRWGMPAEAQQTIVLKRAGAPAEASGAGAGAGAGASAGSGAVDPNSKRVHMA